MLSLLKALANVETHLTRALVFPYCKASLGSSARDVFRETEQAAPFPLFPILEARLFLKWFGCFFVMALKTTKQAF